MIYELHFTEGFHATPVELRIADHALQVFVLTTKVQTGLADIHTFEAQPGQKAELSLPSEGVRAEVTLGATGIFLTAQLQDGRLDLRSSPEQPGHM